MMHDYFRDGAFDRFRNQDYGWMMGRGLLILLGLILVVAIVVVVIVVLVRLSKKTSDYPVNSQMQQQNRSQLPTGQSESADNRQALAILNERYARGEIDDEDYQRRKQNLVR
ncbi:MAG: SHOCT domain-containing protein [Bacillota bacterium]|nr:SHOCT domain-containing protein [Bacillota bacterium]